MTDFLHNSESYAGLTARIVVEELYRLGVHVYAFAPGARSISFLKAIKEHEKAELMLFNDERTLAFWAQGYAKAAVQPCVLVTTSGTACANLLPGVIEAAQAQVPLIVITCDRPWELHGAGANQTIKQLDLLQDFAKTSCHLPALGESFSVHSLLATIDSLVSQVKALPSGVAHLNIALRKPFLSPDFDLSQKIGAEDYKLLVDWFSAKNVFKSHASYFPVPLPAEVKAIELAVIEATAPLIVVGPNLYGSEFAANLLKLAEVISAPVFADINSQLRNQKSQNVIRNYPQILKADPKVYQSDLVLYFGGRIVSEELKSFLQRQNAKQILFTENDLRQDAVENDFLPFTKQVFCKPAQFIKALNYLVKEKENSDLTALVKHSQSLAQKSADYLQQQELLTELGLVTALRDKLPANSLIYHSSSLIFRELEVALDLFPAGSVCLSNRGAVGIDGVIASACGASAALAHRIAHPFLVIGDQAFLHDQNSLALLRNSALKVIVLNNGGGAVFDLLPEGEGIKNELENFQLVNFASLAQAYKLSFQIISQKGELNSRLGDLTDLPKITEVIIDPSVNSASDYRNYLNIQA